jgi:hypothetical protein
MSTQSKVEKLIARQEIADVIYRYARGIDRLDFDLVRACYHPDAFDDHGSFAGSVEDFIAAAETFLPKWVICLLKWTATLRALKPTQSPTTDAKMKTETAKTTSSGSATSTASNVEGTTG